MIDTTVTTQYGVRHATGKTEWATGNNLAANGQWFGVADKNIDEDERLKRWELYCTALMNAATKANAVYVRPTLVVRDVVTVVGSERDYNMVFAANVAAIKQELNEPF